MKSWKKFALAASAALVATSAFAAPVAAQDRAGQAHRPAADFAELPTLVTPKLSPDGNKIATRLAVDGTHYFSIIPLDGGAPQLLALGDNDLNWWRWVNNDWLVVGVGLQYYMPGIGEQYIRRALGVAADGSKTVPLLTRARDVALYADDVIWVANDGSPRILMSLQRGVYLSDPGFWPEVLEFDVSTGRSSRQVGSREGVFNWVADGIGTVRMGIGRLYNGRTYRVLYRDNAGSDFREIVRTTTDSDEEVITPDLFLAEPGKALAVARGDRDVTGLYELDLGTLELGRRLYSSEHHDLGGFYTNPTGDALAGVIYDEDSTRTEWIDPDKKALNDAVQRAFGGGTASIVSTSDDNRRAVVRVGASDSPGAYYLYQRDTGQLTQIAMLNSAIGMTRLNPVRTVRYRARDGLEISAVLILPRGRSENLPLIVLPHGGPFARDDESWDWWTQFLADRGYAVIQPNYRGSSGFGRAFARAGEGQWGLKMQDDLNDAVTYLAEQGIADAGRVCIAGASYGGYAAIRAAQRDPTLYRCAISYAGVSDLDALLRYNQRFLWSGARGDWLRDQAPDFRSVSPIHAPEQIRTPLLLVHGTEDESVPVAQSRDLARKMQSANVAVTYIEQDGADHHFSRREDRLEFLEAMDRFLAEHNPS